MSTKTERGRRHLASQINNVIKDQTVQMGHTQTKKSNRGAFYTKQELSIQEEKAPNKNSFRNSVKCLYKKLNEKLLKRDRERE